MTDAAQIARSLTKAQRDCMTVKAEWRKPTTWAQHRWMTFPPPNTHRALINIGLVTSNGCLTDFGLAVRNELGKIDDTRQARR